MEAVKINPEAFKTEGTDNALDMLFVILGGAGGVARYLHEMIGNKKPFRFFELLAKAFISGFVGLSAGHLAASWALDFDTMFVFTSTAGWLGADSTELFIRWIQKKFPPSLKP